MFLILYGLMFFFGLILGFNIKALVILIIGGIASSFAAYFFNDIILANIISYIVSIVTFYFFLMNETNIGGR